MKNLNSRFDSRHSHFFVVIKQKSWVWPSLHHSTKEFGNTNYQKLHGSNSSSKRYDMRGVTWRLYANQAQHLLSNSNQKDDFVFLDLIFQTRADRLEVFIIYNVSVQLLKIYSLGYLVDCSSEQWWKYTHKLTLENRSFS